MAPNGRDLGNKRIGFDGYIHVLILYRYMLFVTQDTFEYATSIVFNAIHANRARFSFQNRFH